MMLALITLSIAGLMAMFFGFVKSRNLIMPFVFLTTLAALFFIIVKQPFWNHYLTDMVETTGNSRILSILLLLNGLALIPFYNHYQQRGEEELADFLGLVLFSMVGAVLMVTSINYICLFIGVEILSIAMYILAGADRRKSKSNEAALKYFISGSFTSAVLLFGIGLLYATNGSLAISQPAGSTNEWLIQVAYLFVFSGFALKIAVVPFHFWAPDVYEGTPTLFTALMASLVKIASIGAFLRIVQLNLDHLPNWLNAYFILVILATMTFGNLFAMKQQSVKRLMAYSGIVQAGFIMLGFLSMRTGEDWPVLFYFIAYALSSIVAFVVIHFVEQQSGSDALDSFNGLFRSNPLLAIVMTIALVSLAGAPFTSGFIAKLFVLNQAVSSGHTALVVIVVLCTLISVYYYYRIINAMYNGSADKPYRLSFVHALLLTVFSFLTLLAGVIPDYFVSLLR